MAVLLSLTVDEQDKLVRQVASLETAAKSATDAHRQGFGPAGKVVCMVEERLNALKTERKIASNTSLASFWENITRSKGASVKLNSHAMSCAVAFGTYVRSELITEPDYDKNTAQCLELAASISTAVGGEIAHDAVVNAAAELRDRDKDSARKLREILETVKDAKPMTVEQANKALARIFGDGHLNLVIAGVGAEIAHIEDTEIARSAYFGMITANDMFAANQDAGGNRRFTDETINAWATAYADANPQTESAEFETQPIPSPETPAKGKRKNATQQAPIETPAPALAAAA